MRGISNTELSSARSISETWPSRLTARFIFARFACDGYVVAGFEGGFPMTKSVLFVAPDATKNEIQVKLMF